MYIIYRSRHLILYYKISGAFAKLRKATIRFIMSVCFCPSVRMEQLG